MEAKKDIKVVTFKQNILPTKLFRSIHTVEKKKWAGNIISPALETRNVMNDIISGSLFFFMAVRMGEGESSWIEDLSRVWGVVEL